MRAAIGIREHSGWAMLVAVAGDSTCPQVVDRRRITTLDPELPAQSYHAASGTPLDSARILIEAAGVSSREYASHEIRRAISDLARDGYEAVALGCGIGTNPIHAPFKKIMASHALLHASEGDMYRDAIAEAGHAHGLPVTRFPWKAVWAHASAELGIPADALRGLVSAMGRPLGPPWTSDRKEATAIAWLALARKTP